MNKKNNISRKDFLKKATVAGMGGFIATPGILKGASSKVISFDKQNKRGSTKNEIVLTIDPSIVESRFDGIGAVSAGASSRLLIDYPEPERSRLLDYLFKPNFGAGLHHLKVEIGGDVNSTDGTEPSHARTRVEMKNPQREYFERGYEWWLMKEAKKRNPDIILDALAWGAPGWIGNGEYYSQDCADYFASYALGLKKYHNLELNYIGTWNEKGFSKTEGDWIKILRKTLDRNGLQNVRIVANDAHAGPDIWKIADAMQKDRELFDAVDVIGVHYPDITTSKAALDLQKKGKKLWASEDQYNRGMRCNRNYTDRHLTTTEFWSPITSYYDCLVAPDSGLITANTPWSGAFEVLPRLWQLAHTTQFVKPGWSYLKDLNLELPKGGSVVCLVSPDGKEISIIIETMGAGEKQNLKIRPAGGVNLSGLHVWKSTRLEYFVRQNDLSPANGAFILELEPNCNYSLTTTTGQQKGATESRLPGSFPLPYVDNFVSYQEHDTPKYLSDFYGAFEVKKLDNGVKCLRQQIDQKGIQWLRRIPESKNHSAFTVIGDHRWNDVKVSVDASFERSQLSPSKQYVSVIARFYPRNFDCFNEPNPVGYSLRLYADGSWDIITANDTIGKGKLPAFSSKGIRSGWHNLRLECHTNNLQAFVDNHKVIELTDNRYREGLVGIGSYLGPVLFKNLKIVSAG